MKQNRLGMAALVGLLVVACLGAAGFMMMRRYRYMHGGGMAAGRAPGGLVAVSPDGTPAAAPPGTAAQADSNTAVQTVGQLQVALSMTPYPPTSYTPTRFEVQLKDTGGQPIDDATVTLDLTMPEMWMPLNMVDLPSAGGGVYAADGRYTMRGLWRIEVIIERGGQKQSAFFDVVL